MTDAPRRVPLAIEFVYILDRELEIISHYSRTGAGRQTETGRFNALGAIQTLLHQKEKRLPGILQRGKQGDRSVMAMAGQHVIMAMSFRGEAPGAAEQVLKRAVEALDKRWGPVFITGQRPAPEPAIKELVDRLANMLESLQRKAMVGSR
jgi:hypothetical protein